MHGWIGRILSKWHSWDAGSDINGFIKFSCGLEQPWLPMCGSILMAVPLVQAGWCEK